VRAELELTQLDLTVSGLELIEQLLSALIYHGLPSCERRHARRESQGASGAVALSASPAIIPSCWCK